MDIVDDTMPENDPGAIAFLEITDLIERYGEIRFAIGLPTLTELIELRTFEMKLKRNDFTVLLNTSVPRISGYLNGKREIILEVAKSLSKKLNIGSDIILQ